MNATRFFNNSGPVNEADHFCVAPIRRLDTKKVWQLILQKKYFLICGPKQSGKTSYLLALAKVINQKNAAKCLYFNVESLRGIQENLEESMRSVLFEIASRARDVFGDEYLDDMVSGILAKRGPYQAFNELLTQWSKRSDKPIVLLIDEIDTLNEGVLTSMLSQIRAGYDKRPALFPQSIVFCGTHDVIQKQFNIKDATLHVSFFHRDDVDEMFSAFAARGETSIDKDAVDRVWKYSSGQPWIISTLAAELFQEIAPCKGLSLITADQVDEAMDNILARGGNHLEFLASKLREDRVKRCMVPIITSGILTDDISESDLTYLRELGLVTMDKTIEIANYLYKEMIPRALVGPVAYIINLDVEDFLRKDQTLDGVKVARSFQAFFQNHIERLVSLVDYGAAGFFLVFQALLQKMADANNKITREYGLAQKMVILRLRRGFPERQDIVFVLRAFQGRTLDIGRQAVQTYAEDADAWARQNPDAFDEIHVVCMNVVRGADWDPSALRFKRNAAGKPLYVWCY